MRTVVNTLLLLGTAMLTILSSILIVIFAYAGELQGLGLRA